MRGNDTVSKASKKAACKSVHVPQPAASANTLGGKGEIALKNMEQALHILQQQLRCDETSTLEPLDVHEPHKNVATDNISSQARSILDRIDNFDLLLLQPSRDISIPHPATQAAGRRLAFDFQRGKKHGEVRKPIAPLSPSFTPCNPSKACGLHILRLVPSVRSSDPN